MCRRRRPSARAEMVPVVRASVSEAGKLLLSAPARALFDRYLQTLKGKPVELVVRVHRATRSGQANRFYWGVVVPLLAAHCGYDKTSMHEALAYKFLRVEDDPILGSPCRRRTSQLDAA